MGVYYDMDMANLRIHKTGNTTDDANIIIIICHTSGANQFTIYNLWSLNCLCNNCTVDTNNKKWKMANQGINCHPNPTYLTGTIMYFRYV